MVAAFNLLKTQTNLTNYGWSPPNKPGHKEHPLPPPQNFKQTKLFDEHVKSPPRHEVESRERSNLNLHSNLHFINNFLSKVKSENKYESLYNHDLDPLNSLTDIETDAEDFHNWKKRYTKRGSEILSQDDFVEQMFDAKRTNNTEIKNRRTLKYLQERVQAEILNDKNTDTGFGAHGGVKVRLNDKERTELHQVSKILENLLHESNSYYLGDRPISDYLKTSAQTILGNYHPDAPGPYADEPISLIRVQDNLVSSPRYYDEEGIERVFGDDSYLNTRKQTLATGIPRIKQSMGNYEFEASTQQPMVLEGGGSFWTVPQTSNLKRITTNHDMDDATLWGYRGDPKDLEWNARGPKGTHEKLNEVFVRQPIDRKRLVDLSTWAKHKHGVPNISIGDFREEGSPQTTGLYTNQQLIPHIIRGGLGHDGKPLMTESGENIDERFKRVTRETLENLSSNIPTDEKTIPTAILGRIDEERRSILNEFGLGEHDALRTKLYEAMKEIGLQQHYNNVREEPVFQNIHDTFISHIYGNDIVFLRNLGQQESKKIRMHQDISDKAGISYGDALSDFPMNENLWPLDEFGEPLSYKNVNILANQLKNQMRQYSVSSDEYIRQPINYAWSHLRDEYKEQDRDSSLGVQGSEKLLQPPSRSENQEIGRSLGHFHTKNISNREREGENSFQNFYNWPELQEATRELRRGDNETN